jgi:acyl carrier protein
MTANTDSIIALFQNQLSVEVTDVDSDLVGEGLMDSFMLVDLIMFLEQEYNISIDFEGLEIENFRSVSSITKFVESMQ